MRDICFPKLLGAIRDDSCFASPEREVGALVLQEPNIQQSLKS
jgi:hypothetical protein